MGLSHSQGFGEVQHFVKHNCRKDITTVAQEHIIKLFPNDCVLFLLMFYTTSTFLESWLVKIIACPMTQWLNQHWTVLPHRTNRTHLLLFDFIASSILYCGKCITVFLIVSMYCDPVTWNQYWIVLLYRTNRAYGFFCFKLDFSASSILLFYLFTSHIGKIFSFIILVYTSYIRVCAICSFFVRFFFCTRWVKSEIVICFTARHFKWSVHTLSTHTLIWKKKSQSETAVAGKKQKSPVTLVLQGGGVTWLVRWFSLATMARRSLMVISKSCRTGASAGLAPPAHLRRCSMLASSDASFSWGHQQSNNTRIWTSVLWILYFLVKL